MNHLSINIHKKHADQIRNEMQKRGESASTIVSRALNLHFAFARFLSNPRYEVKVKDKLTGRTMVYFLDDDN